MVLYKGMSYTPPGWKNYRSQRRENPPGYDAARLVSRLAEDEMRKHWRSLLERIGIGIVIWYAYIFLPFDFFSWDLRQFLVLGLILPGVVAVTYFIAGAVHHQSHAADHRASRQYKAPRRPLTPAEALEIKRARDAARGRMVERSRLTRQMLHKMYAPPTKGAAPDTLSS